jgi:proline dehydrogenase
VFKYLAIMDGIYPNFDDTQVAFSHKTTLELKKAKVLFSLFGFQPLVEFGSALTGFAMSIGLPISPLYKYTVYDHFCGGESFDDCKTILKKLKTQNVGAMLNYGVELKETEEDFNKTIANTLEAISFAGKNHEVKCICIKITGFGRFDLFLKITDGEPLSESEKEELATVEKRFFTLCEAALQNKVALYVDAEETWIQTGLDALVDKAMGIYNKSQPIVYNTYQLYRKDRFVFLKESHKKAVAEGYILGAKLVRGAYMEKERERAQKMNYSTPIHEDKNAVDKDFDAAMMYSLDNLSTISLCIASQSEGSNLLAVKLMYEKNIPLNHPNVFFSQLYGMGDNITFNLAKIGCNACKYLPYGPVKDVIPYLIRRAEENTSFQGSMGRELRLITLELERRSKN